MPPTERSDQPLEVSPSVSASCGAEVVEICSCHFGEVVPKPRNPEAESNKKPEFVPFPNRTVDDAARPPVKTVSVEVEFAPTDP